MEHNWWGLNKSQRMQLKAFICLLGILLIILLIVGRIIFFRGSEGPGGYIENEPGQTEQPYTPVIQTLTNVWIMEQESDGILIFHEGQRENYAFGMIPDTESGQNLPYQPEVSVREQLADVELTDGQVTDIHLKTEKINGRILGADAEGVEVEGYGKLPLATDYRGYRLYDSLEMCTARDIIFGYSYTDLCIENGEICGILMAKEEVMEYIRVLLKASDYSGIYHQEISLTSNTSFTVSYVEQGSLISESYAGGETFNIDTASSYLKEGRVWIVPEVLTSKIKLSSVKRSQGTPSYRGQIELLLTDQGIVVINEVLLEEYLYSVVPSEMPSGYPAEALKAQAVCARTYAYGKMLHAGYPGYGAHLDDSASYQVYNNILEQESTTTAVKETYGQLLYAPNGKPAETYYYSTSCGVGSDATVWKTQNPPDLPYLQAKSLSRSAMTEMTAALSGGMELPEDDIGTRLQEESEFASFITSVNKDDFEAEEGWYRWVYNVTKLDTEYMSSVLQKRYAANSKLVLTLVDGEYISKEIDSLGNVTDMYVEKRGTGGVAEELVIVAETGTYKVISEHNIRYILNNGKSPIVRQDGSKVSSPTMLPSGFFVLDTGKEKGNVVAYTLTGGGFGHGVGMSQNGARRMARSGFSTSDILLFFYTGCEIRNIYE